VTWNQKYEVNWTMFRYAICNKYSLKEDPLLEENAIQSLSRIIKKNKKMTRLLGGWLYT